MIPCRLSYSVQYLQIQQQNMTYQTKHKQQNMTYQTKHKQQNMTYQTIKYDIPNLTKHDIPKHN